MYMLLTDTANILKVRLVYIMFPHEYHFSGAQRNTSLAFRSIFLGEKVEEGGKGGR